MDKYYQKLYSVCTSSKSDTNEDLYGRSARMEVMTYLCNVYGMARLQENKLQRSVQFLNTLCFYITYTILHIVVYIVCRSVIHVVGSIR